jgi:hypothetical protein
MMQLPLGKYAFYIAVEDDLAAPDTGSRLSIRCCLTQQGAAEYKPGGEFKYRSITMQV